MNTNHAKAIKGMSIANIVLAALGIFGMLIAWAGLGVGGAAISGSGYDYFYTDDGLYFTTDDVSVLLGMLGFLVFLVIVCAVLILIAGILGVRGAAIATVISQTLSALWVLRFLTGRQAELKIGFRGFRPDFACIRRIATLGVSSFVMSFTDSLVQIACNATLLTFGGDIYISVMTVLNSVRQIAQTPVMAIADGATAVISFNYGAKAYSRVRDAIRFMTQLAFG